MRMRIAGGVFLLIALLTAAVVGAATLNTEKWSGNTTLPVVPAEIDGLVLDPENSYAWAMAAYGDYLYVGTNRNYMRQMFEQMSASGDLPGTLGDVFPEATDNAGKIYRKPLNGTGDWELFYDSPEVAVTFIDNSTMPPTIHSEDVVLDYGYRTMEIYNGALYIVTYSFFKSPYSRVLKLPDPEGTSADLREVLRVANKSGSGLRSIGVYEGALFIGTEDLNIWRSDNNDPTPQGPITDLPIRMAVVEVMGRTVYSTISEVGGKMDWKAVGDASSFPGVAYLPQETQGWGGLWDFLSYNGWLYASFADPVNGFSLYKSALTPLSGDLRTWVPIVASQDLNPAAIYPQGLGNKQNTALTMTTFDGYVYAGTFSNWERLIYYIMTGHGGGSILRTWTPPQVYRFNDGDVWEMIVGDYRSTDIAASPYFTDPPLSGWRAGFYDFPLVSDDNYSTVRYVWRMVVHDDMLFLGTMDMMTVLEILAENTSMDLQEFVDDLHTANPNNPAGFDLYVTEDGVNIQAITRNGGFGGGDRYNYGARTLVSTGEGLFLGTANPFNGCQVWKIQVVPEGDDDDEDGGEGGGCAAIPAGGLFLFLVLPMALLLKEKK